MPWSLRVGVCVCVSPLSFFKKKNKTAAPFLRVNSFENFSLFAHQKPNKITLNKKAHNYKDSHEYKAEECSECFLFGFNLFLSLRQ